MYFCLFNQNKVKYNQPNTISPTTKKNLYTEQIEQNQWKFSEEQIEKNKKKQKKNRRTLQWKIINKISNLTANFFSL